MAKIDAKLLTGLKFHGAELKEAEENGRKKAAWVPFERDLTLEDVLGSRETGDSIIIVTSDGQKYTLAKKPAKAE